MSALNSINLYNANVLEQYSDLESQNLEPQLAVFGDNKLIIYSQKTTTVIDKIVQLFKDFFHMILTKCGVITLDPNRVQQLKTDVQDFYYAKLSKSNLETFENLISDKKSELANISNKLNEIEEKLSESEKNKASLNTQIEEMKKQAELLGINVKKMAAIQPEYEHAKELIAQKDALTAEKVKLEKEIDEVKELEASYEPTKQKVNELQAQKIELLEQIKKLKEDTAQGDYKTKYEKATAEITKLHAEIKTQYEAGYSEGKRKGYAGWIAGNPTFDQPHAFYTGSIGGMATVPLAFT